MRIFSHLSSAVLQVQNIIKFENVRQKTVLSKLTGFIQRAKTARTEQQLKIKIIMLKLHLLIILFINNIHNSASLQELKFPLL